MTHEFDRYADVRAALADPLLVPVPPPAEPTPPGTMVWLRATVARFSAGEIHARRRGIVEAELARLDPTRLRQIAGPGGMTSGATGPAGRTSRAVDPAVDEVRALVVRTLAVALGLDEPDAIAAAVIVVAGVYFGGDDPATDEALAWLLRRIGDADEPAEVRANRVGLLVQACDATATLVDHARRATPGSGPHTIEKLLVETLRHDPPVRAMRRAAVGDTCVGGVSISSGDLVTLDIAAANRDPAIFTDPEAFDPDRPGPASLTFGDAPRRCPGSDHAMAIAAGILERGLSI